MMYGYGIGYGYMGFMWLFQIVILVLFFVVLWWIVKNASTFGYKIGNESPLDILKKRLARGEITEKEYQTLKKQIEE
ncbi:SHOCT domain-containing protein [Candidatus Woesearchaeota archaeon]|nr:SHOCT domain-containing protein [Candidatus Woesearchaeota archaeon]